MNKNSSRMEMKKTNYLKFPHSETTSDNIQQMVLSTFLTLYVKTK